MIAIFFQSPCSVKSPFFLEAPCSCHAVCFKYLNDINLKFGVMRSERYKLIPLKLALDNSKADIYNGQPTSIRSSRK